MTCGRHPILFPMPRLNLSARLCFAIAIAVATVSSALAAPAPQDVIELDPARTAITFQLRGNLHTTHGSFQLKSGRIAIDPATGIASGKIVVDAASSTTHNSMRDAEMHDRVLESGTYPEITFVPQTVHATRTAAGEMRGTVGGVITIHGAAHPLMLDISGNVAGDALKFESNFVIPYAAWGMKNPSWLMFRVAGEVNIEFSATARIIWASPGPSASAQMGIPPR
jgi:polyisoprenoid-binding protein YceI